jgi:uncharacterized protein related to proFAR isomerase
MADFIFMLTRDDQTIEDCLEVCESIEALGIGHIGFKDIGVGIEIMRSLVAAIRRRGATSYLEVVSTTPEACLRSARVAVDLGVDRLLGGSDAEEMAAIVADSNVAYFPFPGRPRGHPTLLGGGPAEVANDCRRFEALGCAGVDLLAYRAFEADPLELIRAARGALKGDLIIAGSIDSPARIRELSAAGADAFTIGSAVFEGAFAPGKGNMLAQLKDVLAACVV